MFKLEVFSFRKKLITGNGPNKGKKYYGLSDVKKMVIFIPNVKKIANNREI